VSNAPSEEENVVVEQRMAELIARYGARWSETELTLIRTRIGRSIKLGAALRTVPMLNADEPGNVLKPYRGER